MTRTGHAPAHRPIVPRLKIAFVVDRFGRRFGGAEAYGVALMAELARDHDITVFARDYDADADLQLPWVPVRFWRRWPSWLRVLLAAIRVGRLTRQGYDIVHSHTNGWAGDVDVMHVVPVRYNWRVRRVPPLKRVLSWISPRVWTYLLLEAMRVRPGRAHHVVAVSTLIADQLEAAYGHGCVTARIPPGVHLPAAATPGERDALREQLGFADDHTVCLLVARNPLRKGLRALLAALQELPAHYRLLVVGSDAATDRAVQALPDYQALAGRIVLIHATPDVAPYYRAADICVHPTLNDSFGMAPLEAMSFGLPVIVSPLPWCGLAGYLKDGHDALILTHPDDVSHLAACIERLGADPVLRDRLLEGAAAVVRRHAWPAIAQQYLALYADILKQRRMLP